MLEFNFCSRIENLRYILVRIWLLRVLLKVLHCVCVCGGRVNILTTISTYCVGVEIQIWEENNIFKYMFDYILVKFREQEILKILTSLVLLCLHFPHCIVLNLRTFQLFNWALFSFDWRAWYR